MNKLLNYGLALVLLGFICWYFYSKGKQDATFKQKIEQIEQARKSLEDSIKVLKVRTADRDEKLRVVLLRNTEIMDTLNFTLKKLNANSREIESKITANKKTIDELWKAN